MNWGYIKSWISYVLLYPIKKRRMNRFFSQHGLGDFNLVFDIGAHLGDKTRFFVENTTSNKVIAIEPHPFYVSKLHNRLDHHEMVEIIHKAVGKTPSNNKLLLSSSHPTVSTINPSMPEQVSNQPGWENVKWDRQVSVEVTTLDHLIDIYGIPDFVKIDVEGFEDQVIAGLSKPLPFLSFELLPAYYEPALNSIELLEQLSSYSYAFSSLETFELKTDWLAAEQIQSWLLSYISSSTTPGDIYARNMNRRYS